MRDPFVSYRQWRKKYGDTFLIQALNGDVVVTCNRENIRRIFASPGDAVSPFAVETSKPLVGGTSLFLIDGKQHQCERALLSPSFHGERIAGQAAIIEQVAKRVAERWEVDQTVRIMDSTLDVSLEVIIRVVFGVQSQDRIELFKEKLTRFVSSFHPILAFTRMFQRPMLGLSPWNNFIKARTDFHELLEAEIEARRTDSQQSDLMSRLLNSKYEDGKPVSNEKIRDHLVTLLLAGHETTQIAMAWSMSWLHRQPETLTRLRSQLQGCSTEQILSNEYLTGVCHESLRINSVLSDIVRTLKKPIKLEACELPAGTNLGVAICLVHEDPELYPDPFAFKPERWIGMTRKPNEFMPFGGGIRRCIGASLALLEMKITIATWVSKFEFSLPSDIPAEEPVYRRNITMAPRTGIPLVFEGPRE